MQPGTLPAGAQLLGMLPVTGLKARNTVLSKLAIPPPALAELPDTALAMSVIVAPRVLAMPPPSCAATLPVTGL